MHYKECIVLLSITAAAPSYDYAHPAAAGFSWSVWGGGDTMRRCLVLTVTVVTLDTGPVTQNIVLITCIHGNYQRTNYTSTLCWLQILMMREVGSEVAR